jgi:hypothetical protein
VGELYPRSPSGLPLRRSSVKVRRPSPQLARPSTRRNVAVWAPPAEDEKRTWYALSASSVSISNSYRPRREGVGGGPGRVLVDGRMHVYDHDQLASRPFPSAGSRLSELIAPRRPSALTGRVFVVLALVVAMEEMGCWVLWHGHGGCL